MGAFGWKEARSRNARADEDVARARKPATFLQRILAGALLSVLAVALLNTGVPVLGFIAGAVAICQFAIAAIAKGAKEEPEQ